MALKGMLVDNADTNNRSEDKPLNNKREFNAQSEQKNKEPSLNNEYSRPINRNRELTCPNCGAKLPGGSKFCLSCGAKVLQDLNGAQKIQNETPEKQVKMNAPTMDKQKGKIHCPNCHCTDFTVVSETITSNTSTGGGYSGGKGCVGFLLFGPLGLLCGSCGNKQKITTTNTTKNFFLCSNCGNKFRVPDELKTEIEQTDKSVNMFKIIAIASAICTVLLAMIDMSITRGELGWAVAIGVFDVVIFFVLFIMNRNRHDTLEREYSELISRCME